MALQDIKHVFVLMLENRSFDHMLGFSGLPWIDGLAPNKYYNTFQDDNSPVYAQTVNPPTYQLKAKDKDPGHELFNTFRQLTGQKISDNTFPLSGYKNAQINNKGFVTDYAQYVDSGSPEKVMYCFSPDQIPILTTLASEFAICDCWYSSIPGPTVPNRLFVHAGTSGGLDASIGGLSEAGDFFKPITFENGTIYSRIKNKSMTPGNGDMEWHIYKDGFLALTSLLDDVRQAPANMHSLNDLPSNLKNYANKRTYNFIEPQYGIIANYRTGNSQHPYGDVRQGEALIKRVYKMISSDKDIWNSSLLVILYDEHGGFYDHVQPPSATPTTDQSPELKNTFGFKFDQYGVRVPAIFVSPWIKKGTVVKDIPSSPQKHYDHTSIIRSICEMWGMNSLTPRDRDAQSFLHIIGNSLRSDIDSTLLDAKMNDLVPPPSSDVASTAGQPDDNEPIDNMLESFVRVATMNELEKEGVAPMLWPSKASETLAGITTKLQARQFLQYVNDKNTA